MGFCFIIVTHRIERQIVFHFVCGRGTGAILRIGTGVGQVNAAGHGRAKVGRIVGLCRKAIINKFGLLGLFHIENGLKQIIAKQSYTLTHR